jgi:hypothetical protein
MSSAARITEIFGGRNGSIAVLHIGILKQFLSRDRREDVIVSLDDVEQWLFWMSNEMARGVS